MYFRAFDAAGTLWPSIPMMLDNDSAVEHAARMVMVAGHPAILYYDQDLRALKFKRAEDSLGESWGESLTLVAWTEGSHRMVLLDDRPAVMYQDHDSQDWIMIIANNEEGTSWSLPFVIDLELPDEGGGYFDANWEMFLMPVDGHPAISLRYSFQEDNTSYTSAGIAMYH
jgi:hypothetical protein